jgi:uncharacterized protein (DUF2141 family)
MAFMKNSLFLLAALIPLSVFSQSGIVAEIANLRSDKGVCQVCLFNNKEAFNGNGSPVQCFQAAVRNKKAMVYFQNIVPGKYAILVFHDANQNRKLDKNFLGIPKEGYGASRNDLPFASAPGFEDNSFEVKPQATTRLSIRLRYL